MEWISVEDRLPPNDDNVLCYYPRDGICVGNYHEDEVSGYYEKDGTFFHTNHGWEAGFQWAILSFCTHWMPLPPFPDEKKTIKYATPVQQIETIIKPMVRKWIEEFGGDDTQDALGWVMMDLFK